MIYDDAESSARPLAAHPSYNPAPRQINGVVVVTEGECRLAPWCSDRAGPARLGQ